MWPHSHVRCRGAHRGAPRRKVLTALLPAALLCAGCALSAPRRGLIERFQDEDPAVRAAAAAEAAGSKDPKTLPYLVDRLGDPEADVRLMASAALLQRTGATYGKMGWRFYDPGPLRDEAVGRWRQWLREQGMKPLPAGGASAGGASRPAASRPARTAESAPGRRPQSPASAAL